MVKNMTGRSALNDHHGSIIYPTDLDPVFAWAPGPQVVRTMQVRRFSQIFEHALESGHLLSERERVAFDLYAASFWTHESADARFVLLFAAIEALIEDIPRPPKVLVHVDKLIRSTEEADLPDGERESLVGTLKWLRSYSIRHSGRALMQRRLAGRIYSGMPAEDLFLESYNLRNRLVHGVLPFPTRDEVSQTAGKLEPAVGHLLSGPVLDLTV